MYVAIQHVHLTRNLPLPVWKWCIHKVNVVRLQFNPHITLIIIIIIIIIKACWQHGFPWLFLSLSLFIAIRPYWPSQFVSPLEGSQCLHRADNFFSSCLSAHTSGWKSVRELHLSVRPYFACMSCLFYFDDFRDWWQMALQILLCKVLLPGFVQNSTQLPCADLIKPFI